MEALARFSCLATCSCVLSGRKSVLRLLRRSLLPTNPTGCVLKTSSSPVGERAEDDILQTFLKERKLKGDFISRASDVFWKRAEGAFDAEPSDVDNTQKVEEFMRNNESGGFLKLSRTNGWVKGVSSAPVNQKVILRESKDESDRRKRLNLLNYEALKRELLFLSVGIGTACSGYCLIALSVQAGVSYAVGVLFSCLYLQLLYQHTDNISKENVPPIFMQKKSKKIGIRSEDIKNFIERSVKGSATALSSPRLMIPAAIYGLWILSHRYFANYVFDFQLVPAMVGMFVYKAAALVQVYRDNRNLEFVFPENEEDLRD